MKLAIVDLDGVVANADLRFAQAEEAKHLYMIDPEVRRKAVAEGKKTAADAYWRAAFDPVLVALDDLIEDAGENLMSLALQGYDIVFLTSRPEDMRWATFEWLGRHGLLEGRRSSSKRPLSSTSKPSFGRQAWSKR